MKTPLYTTAQIARLTQGSLSGPDLPVTSLTTDSRQATSGSLFVCLKGPQADGHDHIPEAIAKKAGALLVAQDTTFDAIGSAPIPVIRVPDTFKALVLLGQGARDRVQGKIAGVTGSFGKTTTKECLGHILSTQGPVHITPRSFNNAWGVPISLATMPEETRFGIFEMGMNHSGEIRPLTKQVRPHVALITNIGDAHAGNFQNITGIAQAKADIFQGLLPGGIAIINGDQPEYEALFRQSAPSLSPAITWRTYGKSPTCDYQLIKTTITTAGQQIDVRLGQKKYRYICSFLGEHWALNTLAALAIVDSLGADINNALEQLETFHLLPGRGRLMSLSLGTAHATKAQRNITILDESYNGNPQATMLALDQLIALPTPTGKRRIAILGDLLELKAPEKEHAQLGAYINTLPIDGVCVSGSLMSHLWNALAPEKRFLKEDNPQILGEKLAPLLKGGDCLLIKGSRGQRQYRGRMHDVIAALEKQFQQDTL